MTDEWLDFIADCRRGIEHFYDIVEGPMANDTIWDYVEDFFRGAISRAAFWELAKFRHPTHQIVFCKVYTRLILDTMEPDEDYIHALIRIYNDEICEKLDLYDCGAYYEPSYVIPRAYKEGGF